MAFVTIVTSKISFPSVNSAISVVSVNLVIREFSGVGVFDVMGVLDISNFLGVLGALGFFNARDIFSRSDVFDGAFDRFIGLDATAVPGRLLCLFEYAPYLI